MNHLHKIDSVLNFLCASDRIITNYSIAEELVVRHQGWYHYPKFERELIDILIKLQKDNYVALGDTRGMNIPSNTEAYFVTFEGKVFSEQGGYRGQHQERTLAERRVRTNQTLTWILAVGVIPPFAWNLLDVVRNFYPHLIRPLRDYVLPYGTLLFLLWLLYKVLKSGRPKRYRRGLS